MFARDLHLLLYDLSVGCLLGECPIPRPTGVGKYEARQEAYHVT